MDEKIRFSGWAAWLDGDSIWWCQDEHCGSAPMQPRTGFEEDMLDEIRRLRADLVECRAKHMDDLLVLGETAKAERELRAELAGMTDHRRAYMERAERWEASCARAVAELVECKRDAERYRTALEQIVAPFEDLNFVSGNKLLSYIHDTATTTLAARGSDDQIGRAHV